VRAFILNPSLPEGIHIRVLTATRQLPACRLLLVRMFALGSCATLQKGNQETLGQEEDEAQVGTRLQFSSNLLTGVIS